MRLAPSPLLPILACTLLYAGAVRAGVAAGEARMAIGEVQGQDVRSPREGQSAVVQGVVTGNFSSGLGGFFMQDAGDGDAKTSDALFVIHAADALPALRSGDRVRVHGVVVEDTADNRSGTMTALLPERIEVLGRGEIARQRIQDAPQDWEALEGMWVQIDAPLTLSGTDPRFGETTASFDGRLWTPTEIAIPGSSDIRQFEADNARRRLVLDDASNRRDPGRTWYLPAGTPRGGSIATGVQGIVDQRHGQYRLQLTEPLNLTAAARPDAPKVDGTLKVAVFNLENLFNGDGQGGGFPTQRGAKSPAQLQAQTAKLVATLHALDADVAALMELENDGYGPASSIAQFVDALNENGGDWRFVDAGSGPGEDEIRVGLIYRGSKVTPQGKPAVLEGGPFGDRSRVPLAQAFKRNDGPTFVVVANHFKSKGCSEATGADLDAKDGQGCWNALRADSAKRLHAWLQTDPTGHDSALKLIVGDLNAYAMEQPVRVLRDAGWVDAFTAAKVDQPYSYVYNGQSGRLDHALLSPALAGKLKGAREWHSNADEPDAAGYADDNAPGPWRSSDHDPMLLGFDL